jgi:hypothetical protein
MIRQLAERSLVRQLTDQSSNVSFLSEAGEVLTFFGDFLVSRQKVTGVWGETPISNQLDFLNALRVILTKK